jgi:hypothetical protein
VLHHKKPTQFQREGNKFWNTVRECKVLVAFAGWEILLWTILENIISYSFQHERKGSTEINEGGGGFQDGG